MWFALFMGWARCRSAVARVATSSPLMDILFHLLSSQAFLQAVPCCASRERDSGTRLLACTIPVSPDKAHLSKTAQNVCDLKIFSLRAPHVELAKLKPIGLG